MLELDHGETFKKRKLMDLGIKVLECMDTLKEKNI